MATAYTSIPQPTIGGTQVPMPTLGNISQIPPPIKSVKPKGPAKPKKAPAEKPPTQFADIPALRIQHILAYEQDVERQKIYNQMSDALGINVQTLSQLLEKHGISRSAYKKTAMGEEILKNLDKIVNARINVVNRLHTRYLNIPEGRKYRERLEKLQFPFTITDNVYKTMAQLVEYYIRCFTTISIRQAHAAKDNIISPEHLINGINVEKNPEISECCLYRALAIHIEYYYMVYCKQVAKKAKEDADKQMSEVERARSQLLQQTLDNSKLEEDEEVSEEQTSREVRTPEALLCKYVHSIIRSQIREDHRVMQQGMQEKYGHVQNIVRDEKGLPRITTYSVSSKYVDLMTSSMIEFIVSTLTSAAKIRMNMNNGESGRPKVNENALLAVLEVYIETFYAGGADEEQKKLQTVWSSIIDATKAFKTWRYGNALRKAAAKTELSVEEVEAKRKATKERTSALRALTPAKRSEFDATARQLNPQSTPEEITLIVSNMAVEFNSERKTERLTDAEAKKVVQAAKKTEEEVQQQQRNAERDAKSLKEYHDLYKELAELMSQPITIPKPPVLNTQSELSEAPAAIVSMVANVVPQPIQVIQPVKAVTPIQPMLVQAVTPIQPIRPA
jgi:hypothetical protein